jgi:phage shock protein A
MGTSLTTTGKSLWKQKEGPAAMGISAILAAAALYALYKMLPALLAFATGVLQLAIIGIAIAFIGWMFVADAPRTLISYGLRVFARFLTSIFVELDPIGIIREYVARMKERLEVVQESIAGMAGVARTIEGEIERNSKEMREYLTKAGIAERQGDQDALNTYAEMAERRDHDANEYRAQYADIKETLDALQDVEGLVKAQIASSEDEADRLARKDKIAREVGKATSAAKAALGYNRELEIKNMAAEEVRSRYDQKMGGLDALVNMTRDLKADVDMDKMVFREGGKAKLAALRAKMGEVEGEVVGDQKMLTAGEARPVLVKTPEQVASQQNRWSNRANRRKSQ